jgi:ribosome-associated toxin RatA of RatAB toxin-antitoxin module
LKHIQKTALVSYTPEQMYSLVDDIDAYAEFLPWCSRSEVIARQDGIVDGSLEISYSKLNKTFTTRNINTPNEKIEMQLLEGPFKKLHGEWTFQQLGKDGTKVMLNLEFEFANRFLDMTVGPVFSQIANSLVDAFTQRARDVYG